MVNDESPPNNTIVSVNIESDICLKSSYHFLSWYFSIHTNMNVQSSPVKNTLSKVTKLSSLPDLKPNATNLILSIKTP